MSSLFIYCLMVYGLCNIIIFGNGPFHFIKKTHEWLQPRYPMLNEMLTCFICLPTQCGFVFSALNILLFPTLGFTPMNTLFDDKALWPIIIFLDGMFASGIIWLIHTFQEMMERIGINNGE